MPRTVAEHLQAPAEDSAFPACVNHTMFIFGSFIVKRVVDFLLVLIELFSLGVTAQALQAIIGSKSGAD